MSPEDLVYFVGFLTFFYGKMKQKERSVSDLEFVTFSYVSCFLGKLRGIWIANHQKRLLQGFSCRLLLVEYLLTLEATQQLS